MWSAEIEGGRGEDHHLHVLAGYPELPALLTEVGQVLSGWSYVTDATVRLAWRHPEARGKGRA
jgi:hypothetical protein